MGTYDELRYKKTHIFAYVRIGQPTGSKEINNYLSQLVPLFIYNFTYTS